ncbi:MAG TPA: RidA family protein [Flavitalea sp.]|nr:RidA family protein [Flavitalea sp.]HTF30467.1 RidA family protein [Flavitalea sp.]
MKTIIFATLVILLNLSLNAQSNMNNKIPLSPSLKVGDLLFISGQVGIDPTTSKLSDANFEAEVRQVMNNLQSQLKEHGLTLEHLASAIIYLKDMKNYSVLNEVYGSYFKDKFPTRTCIAVLDLPVKASVEISGIAHFKK